MIGEEMGGATRAAMLAAAANQVEAAESIPNIPALAKTRVN